MSSISSLPESTARLLKSHINISSSETLIKELLDNAIDAEATSIDVLISDDTISKIEVRDNGTGIHPDDYDALGRRAHTSKLKSIDQLRTVPSRTLGFRGEALASINSVANVSITTKSSAEPVAAALQLVRGEGGVATQRPASAPMGTTVTVTNLFDRLPVREQAAIRESDKIHERILVLLQAYAMARPQIKLTRNILSNPARKWLYSPKRRSSVMEAALQILGTQLAASCLEKTVKINSLGALVHMRASEIPVPVHDEYVLETCLIKPNGDPSKLPKHRFLSVDGRPITTKRNIGKRLSVIYNEHLRNSAGHFVSTDHLSHYFIRVNIRCPAGSYDANIEPSKDDVLFSDESIVINGFKALCIGVYGVAAAHKERAPSPDEQPKLISVPGVSTQTSKRLQGAFIDQSQEHPPKAPSARRTAETQLPSQPLNEVPSVGCFSPVNSLIPVAQNEGESVECAKHGRADCAKPTVTESQASPQDSQLRAGASAIAQDGKSTNPWVIAKNNVVSGGALITNGKERNTTSDSSHYTPELPMTPDLPVLRHVQAPPGDLDIPPSHRHMFSQTHASFAQMVASGGYRSPISSPLVPRHQNLLPETPKRNITNHGQPNRYLPRSPPSSIERKEFQDGLTTVTARAIDPESLKQASISFNHSQFNKRKRQRHMSSHGLGQSNPCTPDIELGSRVNSLQDRYAVARKGLYSQRPPVTQTKIQSSSPDFQPLKDRQALHSLSLNTYLNDRVTADIKEPIKTTIPADDPRAYLLRRQKSLAADKGARAGNPKRMKSCMLPLENISEEQQVHSLCYNMEVDIQALSAFVELYLEHDQYTTEGAFEDSIPGMSLADGRTIEGKLCKLLEFRRESIGREGSLPEFNLASQLKGKGKAIGT
ncbi:hypothetical protein F5Y15DRAFT_424829 [Xylariaceae sp. FL0016]|nr:hypothetical protein F5Y15DRAFT_424829 [Xylariaceae sp. FL0016]